MENTIDIFTSMKITHSVGVSIEIIGDDLEQYIKLARESGAEKHVDVFVKIGDKEREMTMMFL